MVGKKIVWLLLLLFVGKDFCQGQIFGGSDKLITVKLLNKDEGNTPLLESLNVFVFNTPSQAYEAAQLYDETSEWPKSAKNYAVSQDGVCSLTAPLKGGIMIAGLSMEKAYYGRINGQMELAVSLSGMGRTVRQVDITAKAKLGPRPQPGKRFGNKLKFENDFPVLPQYAQTNARVVLAPVALDCQEGDTFSIPHPWVMDGGQYKTTQRRRMGYDEENDSLIVYRVDETMETRQRASIHVADSLEKLDMDKSYRCDIKYWYEDYNIVYFQDSFNCVPCEARIPLRFLEFKVDSKEINPEDYRKNPQPERHNQPGSLSLTFVVGKAELDSNDSTNFIQLDKLKSELSSILNSEDGTVQQFDILGQSSPDGRYAVNERLGYDRMMFAFNEIASIPGMDRRNMTKESRVADWEQVADSLFADSLKECAEQVRAIIRSTSNKDAQFLRIAKLPCYEKEIKKILPRLRTVYYQYQYEINRAFSPIEVLERWQTDKDFRSGKREFALYEFGYLFDQVKDPKELEILARRAYRVSKNMGNPWPLAAYHLAQCYLKRDTCDTTLLSPFIRFDRIPNFKRYGAQRPDGTRPVEQIINDEAIVSTQIVMMVKKGDFEGGYGLTGLLPKTEESERLRKFLDCLNGGYEDNEEIREYVASTSPMNCAVIYSAMNNRMFDEMAMEVLDDTMLFPNQNDPKILYLKAIVSGRSLDFVDEYVLSEDNTYLLECCKQDERYYRMARNDGDFTEDYRKAFDKVWEMYKNGELDAPGF
ncbi:MAG: hypothetical protein K2N13_05325 [Paraprevotella sp.]|nr:hypothetical protein [Paraprevotella sp.]